MIVAVGGSSDASAFGDGKRGKMGMKGGMKGGMAGGAPSGLRDGMRAAFLARSATVDAMESRGFLETGLRPVYPDGLHCGTANSFFADTRRGDGSNRSMKYYKGRHGGLDIPAKGIDIIAMADGEVVEKATGDAIGGIKVVLRHSPQDTGLNVWTFTEYKHLKDESPLALGARVRQGTPVGIAGNTGTTGGRAYGAAGHYHLHLTTWYNATGDFKDTKFMLVPSDGYWLDPLAMMRGGPLASAHARDLATPEKQVRFAYRTADGTVHPAGAKVIWPFVCR